MARRDEYGRFTSDDDTRSRRRYEDDDDDRYYARSGSRSQSRYEDDDDDRYYARSGSRSQSRYEDDDDDRYYSRGVSRRGFAGMDPEEQRRIAHLGGLARWGEYQGARGRSSRYDEDDDDRYDSRRGSSRRGFAAMDPDEQRRIAHLGGLARWGEYEGQGSGSRGRSSRYDEDDDDRYYSRRGSSRRGFAAMDPEEQRRISHLGGLARWGEYEGQSRSSRYDEDDDDDRYARRSGRSRRGFAAMDPEEQREIARMGGRASHGGR